MKYKKNISKIILSLFFLLFLVMALAVNVAVPDSYLPLLSKAKYVVLFILLVVFVVNEPFSWRGSLGSVIVGLAFPLYYLFISFVYKNDPNYMVVLLYFVWASFVFFLVPRWLDSQNLKAFLCVAYTSGIVVVLIGIVFSYLGLIDGILFSNRVSYGYLNPNFYSQFLQIIFISGCIFLDKGNRFSVSLFSSFWGRMLGYFLLFLSVYMAFEARSRNVLVAMLVFYVMFKTLKYRGGEKIGAIAVVLYMSILAGFSAFLFELEYLNEKSSGRLYLWEATVEKVKLQGPSVELFGAIVNPDLSSYVISYSREYDGSEGHGKFRADNIYLEIFVEGGVIGLILFFAPYVGLYLESLEFGRNGSRTYIALVASFLAQGFFVSNVASFFAPASLFYAVLIHCGSLGLRGGRSPKK